MTYIVMITPTLNSVESSNISKTNVENLKDVI